MPLKGSKITDPIILERLAKAREKANETRRQKADDKKTLKLADDVEHHQKISAASDKINKVVKEKEPEPEKPQKSKSKPKPPPSSSSESDSSSDSSSSSEEVIIKKKKKDIKKKHVIVYRDREEPPPPRPQPPAPPAAPIRQPLTAEQKRRILLNRSLFGD